jgi:hypothetical protein
VDANVMMVVIVGDKKLQKELDENWDYHGENPLKENRAAYVRQLLTTAKALADRKKKRVVLLRYKEATWDNISYLLKDVHDVKMVEFYGHGNSSVPGGIPRLNVQINGAMLFSYLGRDFTASNPPPGGSYTRLDRQYEDMPSVASLGNRQTHKLNWVRFNSCYTGQKYQTTGGANGFAHALGFVNWDGASNNFGIFIGWGCFIPIDDTVSTINAFEVSFWSHLYRNGGEESVGTAFNNALSNRGDAAFVDMASGPSGFTTYGVAAVNAHFNYPDIRTR